MQKAIQQLRMANKNVASTSQDSMPCNLDEENWETCWIKRLDNYQRNILLKIKKITQKLFPTVYQGVRDTLLIWVIYGVALMHASLKFSFQQN